MKKHTPLSKVLVTVSGGRSSAYMAIKLYQNYQDMYDMTFVYANTGQEHNKTLDFVNNIEKHFKIPIIWVEAAVHEKGVSTTHKIVDYTTASRTGEPFEDVIKKYGLPTIGYMHCTRELKINPMDSLMKERGILKKTLGIRFDEKRRYHPRDNILYPLYDWKITKKMVNDWWQLQPFDLEIPDYLGNCTWCYKKSDTKLDILVSEHKEVFNFPLEMEKKYQDPSRKIFRGYRTTQDVLDSRNINLFNFDVCAEECGTILV